MTYLIIPLDRGEVGRRYGAWDVISADVHATDEDDSAIPVIGLVVWYRSGPEGSPILDLAYLELRNVWSAIADSYAERSDADRDWLARMLNVRLMVDNVTELRVWSNWCAGMRAKQPVPPWRIGDAGDH